MLFDKSLMKKIVNFQNIKKKKRQEKTWRRQILNCQ